MSFPTAPMRSLLDAAHKAALPEDEGNVWALNLDQIESHSGKVLAKVMLDRNEVGPSTYVFNKGTVLYCKLRPYLNKVVVADDDGVATTELVPLRCDESKVLPHYLAHFLRSATFLAFATNVVAGAKMPRMVMSEFWSYPVPLPPLEEQRRIAAILDQAETLRTQRRTALALLDSLTQSLFLDTHLNAPLEDVLLASVAENNRGSFVNGPFGSDLLTSELQTTGVPVVYIRDIRDGEYKRVSEVFVSENKAASLSVCEVRSGDVLIAKVGDPPGVSAVYPEGLSKAIVTQDVIRIRVDKEKFVPEYLSHYINSSLGRWKLSGITIEATRARFSLGDLKRLQIQLPPLPLQQTFATHIASIEALKATHRRALAALDALFASLQQRAFAGAL